MDFERLLAFTQKLIRTASLSGEENVIAQFILDEMLANGFSRASLDSNGSVLGILEGAQPGPTILLDAHCDTVGIAPGSTRTHDPFGAEVENGLLYGRGVADMKGALAAMLCAIANLNPATLRGRVALSATVMEEVMEGVALQSVVESLAPDAVIIGESTNLRLNRGGRGRAEIQLETIGKPAHSSSPQMGKNAVHAMTKVIAAMESLPMPTHPLLGPALQTLTDIISEPYPAYSVIPSRCRVSYDRRLLPGETPQSVLALIRAHPALSEVEFNAKIAEGEHITYTGNTLRGEKFFPAWEIPTDHPLIQAGLRGLSAAGLPPETGAYRFCTNGAYSAGVAGIPTLGFGPGREEDAHITDEALSLQALKDAARGYQALIESISEAFAPEEKA
ncbi:MAG: YgeY family selenium metabolism-linked hydrolase [Anaerolineales bacterium]